MFGKRKSQSLLLLLLPSLSLLQRHHHLHYPAFASVAAVASAAPVVLAAIFGCIIPAVDSAVTSCASVGVTDARGQVDLADILGSPLSWQRQQNIDDNINNNNNNNPKGVAPAALGSDYGGVLVEFFSPDFRDCRNSGFLASSGLRYDAVFVKPPGSGVPAARSRHWYSLGGDAAGVASVSVNVSSDGSVTIFGLRASSASSSSSSSSSLAAAAAPAAAGFQSNLTLLVECKQDATMGPLFQVTAEPAVFQGTLNSSGLVRPPPFVTARWQTSRICLANNNNNNNNNDNNGGGGGGADPEHGGGSGGNGGGDGDGDGSKTTKGAGSVMTTLFLITTALIAAYFVAGFLYRRTVLGHVGLAQIPHYVVLRKTFNVISSIPRNIYSRIVSATSTSAGTQAQGGLNISNDSQGFSGDSVTI